MCGGVFAQRLGSEAERMTTSRVQGHPLLASLSHFGTSLGQNETLTINLDWLTPDL